MKWTVIAPLALALPFIPAPAARAQEESVKGWVEKLNHKDVAVRIQAARALNQLGPAAKDAIPALVDALQDENPVVRREAVTAIGLIRAQPEIAIPALRKPVNDTGVVPKEVGSSIADAALIAIGNYGPQGKAAVPDLFQLAKEGKDAQTKVLAIGSLTQIKAGPELMKPLLTDILAGKNEGYLKSAAATCLAVHGPDPKTVKLLLNAFDCEDVDDAYRKKVIQFSIVQALGKMADHAEPHVPWLISLFKDLKGESSLRAAAFQAVGDLGRHGKDAVPVLIECLNDPKYRRDSTEVINALAKIGELAVVALAKNLDHPDADSRQLTAEALGKMGPRAGAAIPALENAIHGIDTPVTRGAIRALEQIRNPGKKE